jgi:hypothetical protein
MPFRLFGPCPLADQTYCVRLFEVGGDFTILDKTNVDPKIKKQLGRAHARAEHLSQKNRARDADITKGANSMTSTPNARGLTFNHQVQVAVVALHTAAAEEKSNEQAINTFIFQISQQSLKVDRLYKRAERLGGSNEESKYWKECQVEEDALDSMHTKLEGMKVLQSKRSPQRHFVDHFLESVITPPLILKRPCLVDSTNIKNKKKPKNKTPIIDDSILSSDESDLGQDPDLGFGFCCAGSRFCDKVKRGRTLALDAGCFNVSSSLDEPKHRCMTCRHITHSALCGTGEGKEFECGQCADM